MTHMVIHATASIMQTPLAVSTITRAATRPAIGPSSAKLGFAETVNVIAAASQPVRPNTDRGASVGKRTTTQRAIAATAATSVRGRAPDGTCRPSATLRLDFRGH